MLVTSLLLCSLEGSTSNEGLFLIVKKTFSSSETGCEKLGCDAPRLRQYVWIYGRRRYLLNPSISTALLNFRIGNERNDRHCDGQCCTLEVRILTAASVVLYKQGQN